LQALPYRLLRPPGLLHSLTQDFREQVTTRER
jgi:hypothetical protein